jgi:vacuole membrane protein 1
LEGGHNKYFEQLNEILIFVVWWVGLGVASSIGLGSGLHTFVLYLGPHLAKIAIFTNECKTLPQMIPSRYNFNNFGECV